jgi:hypothetical protein
LLVAVAVLHLLVILLAAAAELEVYYQELLL